MTLKNVDKAPFPWFGGKSQAAPLVWELLGDVPHYVEPFAGSLAVLIGRPHLANRPYYSETVNDLDCLLVNVWRAIQQHPEETAEHASWPITEADKMARQLALVRWRETEAAAHLRGDSGWCDPQMAGWWLWGVATAIGATWCNGGPWTADEAGFAYKQDRDGTRRAGVTAELPHLVGNQGINHPGTRQPGVIAGLPHLSNSGRGINRPGTRQPGVTAELPHLGNDGQGINHPGTRQPGVTAERPHLGNNGQGINHAGTRQPGVTAQRPHLGDNGQGINRPGTRQPGVSTHLLEPHEYHPIIMPELTRWMAHLAARLRHVRIVNGDWKRVVTGGATKTLPVRMTDGQCGIFLDPPYADTASRTAKLYAEDSFDVAHEVREWALQHGNDPDYRIIVAGYEGEHTTFEQAGWTSHEWFKKGFLTGGMANTGDKHADGIGQQNRERLWASPHCTLPEPEQQPPQLFDTE